MATCKENCLHYEACKATYEELTGDSGTGGNAEYCKYFQDRSKFIELPCKVGQELYRVKHLGKGTVTTTSLNANTFWRIVMQGEFGRTVFLTKKEAEKALKEAESMGQKNDK